MVGRGGSKPGASRDGGSSSPARGEGFVRLVSSFIARGGDWFAGGPGGCRGQSSSEEGAGAPREGTRGGRDRGGGSRECSDRSLHGEPKGGRAGPSEGATAEAPRQPTIRELCRFPAGGEDEPYLALVVGAIPRGEAADPLVGRWEGLTRGSRVWADGDCAAGFICGGLHPDIARDLYVMASETLLSKSAKSLLWGHHYAATLMDRVCDAGRVITALGARNAELRRQMDEASTERGVELQTRLEASEGNNTSSTRLRASVAEARSARADSLELIRRLEELRAEARRASEDLEAEICLRSEKDKKLIEDYKVEVVDPLVDSAGEIGRRFLRERAPRL
ncbi:hypothetical protein C4D60_Mb08t11380 [Musa balbisiana]|uniref:Uncharacterized protein n=1 Tax=Musa balbisiana TaxID=52838 RepID=A0A4S8K304_MUSBA|nr:hypothetical protein C4D60_Mb08t11380 [Musa balbisiana]